MLDAIDKLKEADTRDELGLAAIRDGFADHFFPGTGTLQTRARYFLFAPWSYKRAEAKRSSISLAERLRADEVLVRDALVIAAEDERGIIGKRSGVTTKRLASSIYWSGLGAWRIRTFPGSQDDYHRAFAQRARREAEAIVTDDRERVDGRVPGGWDPHLPSAPAGFPTAATFALTREEATYLRERVLLAGARKERTLLAHLVERPCRLDYDYLWEHPRAADVPPALRAGIAHARNFAEAMHGAALLYNLMLSEETPEAEARQKRVADFEKRMRRWRDELEASIERLAVWDRPAFWTMAGQIANVRTATRTFVDGWLDLKPWTSFDAATGKRPRDLVRDREARIKVARRRLGNPRAQELWGGDSGSARLTFRWEVAVRLLRDIYAGLSGEVLDA